MAKRISDRERLLAMAMTGTKDQLTDAVEIFRTALRHRFPVKRVKVESKKGGQAGEQTQTLNS